MEQETKQLSPDIAVAAGWRRNGGGEAFSIQRSALEAAMAMSGADQGTRVRELAKRGARLTLLKALYCIEHGEELLR